MAAWRSTARATADLLRPACRVRARLSYTAAMMRVFRLANLLLMLVLLSLPAMQVLHASTACASALASCQPADDGKADAWQGQMPDEMKCCVVQASLPSASGTPAPTPMMAPRRAHEPGALRERAITPPQRPPQG